MAPEVHYTEAGKRFVVLLRPVVNTGQYIKRRVLKKEIDIYLIRFIHSRSHRDIESSAEAFRDRSFECAATSFHFVRQVKHWISQFSFRLLDFFF